VAGVQDVGFLRHGLLRPVSEKGMPDKCELAAHQPHHWRAIDRNIPSQARVPALPESVSPGNFKCIGAVPKMQNYRTQEPMPRKSTKLDPRIDINRTPLPRSLLNCTIVGGACSPYRWAAIIRRSTVLPQNLDHSRSISAIHCRITSWPIGSITLVATGGICLGPRRLMRRKSSD